MRIAIIGMNNPYTGRERYALWPDPPRCTGWRLWQMTAARTGATPADYVRAFHRYNVLVGPWSDAAARESWRAMEPVLLENFDRILLLGRSVCKAAGVRVPGNLCVTGRLLCIPHPSGLNLWYNSAFNRTVVEILMEELYTQALM